MQVIGVEIESKVTSAPVAGATVEWDVFHTVTQDYDRSEVEPMVDDLLDRPNRRWDERATNSSGHVELEVGCVLVQTGQVFPQTRPIGVRITVSDDRETLLLDPFLNSTAESASYTASVTSVSECVPLEY